MLVLDLHLFFGGNNLTKSDGSLSSLGIVIICVILRHFGQILTFGYSVESRVVK